ncbi:MAG TPA: hypothetical protein VJC13_02995 [Candidatus Paceibacterota bacterium]
MVMGVKRGALLSFGKKKEKKYRPWRELWSADFIARENHTCNNCHYDIFGGDVYTRTVFRCNERHLFVERVHSDPDCPVDPWEEEQKIHEEIRRESKAAEKRARSKKFKAAA